MVEKQSSSGVSKQQKQQSSQVSYHMFARANQTGDYFVLGPKSMSDKDRSAFTVYRLDDGNSLCQKVKHAGPQPKTVKKELKCELVEMLGNSNIFSFVIRTAPTNKLFIWDDKHAQILAEFSFQQKVQDVKLTQELIIVVLIDEIHAYKFADLTFIKKWQYASEPSKFIDFKRSERLGRSILTFYDTEAAWQPPVPEQVQESQQEQTMETDCEESKMDPNEPASLTGEGVGAKQKEDEFITPKVRVIQFDHKELGQDNMGVCMTKVKIMEKMAIVSIGQAEEINAIKLSQDGTHLAIVGKFRFPNKFIGQYATHTAVQSVNIGDIMEDGRFSLEAGGKTNEGGEPAEIFINQKKEQFEFTKIGKEAMLDAKVLDCWPVNYVMNKQDRLVPKSIAVRVQKKFVNQNQEKSSSGVEETIVIQQVGDKKQADQISVYSGQQHERPFTSIVTRAYKDTNSMYVFTKQVPENKNAKSFGDGANLSLKVTKYKFRKEEGPQVDEVSSEILSLDNLGE